MIGLIFVIGFAVGIVFGFIACFFLVKTAPSRENFLQEIKGIEPSKINDEVFLGVKE